MPLTDIDLHSDHDSSAPSATDKVRAAVLDVDNQTIEQWLNTTLRTAWNKIIRADDTLVDQLVRSRNLHPEVTALIASKAGWQPKADVQVASTANINLAAPGATIDTRTMVANDRFLAKNQTTPSQNGIYVWNGAATPATRATDADTSTELGYAFVTVAVGSLSTQAGTSWVCSQSVTDIVTLGTTAITFGQAGGQLPSAAMQPVVTALSVTLARLALGISAVMDGVVTAATLAAARSAFMAGSVMDPVVNAATLAASRAAQGPWGDAVSTATTGSAALSMAARFGKELSPEDFGAIGDGATDDTTAVQAAFAAINAGTVKRLRLKGYYKVGAAAWVGLTISAQSNVAIVGDGWHTGFLFTNAPSQNIQALTTFFLTTGCTNVRLADFKIDCNALEHVGVGVMGSSNVVVEKIYVTNSPGTIGNSRPAFVFHSSSFIRFAYCYTKDTSSAYCFGLSTTLGQITDSVMEGCIFNNSRATNAMNATRSIMRGCVMNTCLYCGVEINGVGTAATDWSIESCIFRNCTQPAIQVSALVAGGLTNHGKIVDCDIIGGAAAGIYCFGDVADVLIANNRIRDNLRGIVLTLSAAGGCKRFKVLGNQVYDSRSGGSRTQQYGIQLDLATSGGGAITGEALADIEIEGNTVRNHTDTGIIYSWTSGTASYARIKASGNRVNDNTSFGISVGIGNPTGLWASMSLVDNECENNGGNIRLSILISDINNWYLRDNRQANGIGSPYVIGGLGGVPTMLGLRGVGTPEAAIAAGVGSTFCRVDGGAATSLYVKQTATVNTGWAGK